MVKGRAGPQQFLVQQSVSSAAKYTLCPNEFLISYLLFDSNPIKTGKKRSNRTVNSWGASAWTTDNKSTKLTLTYCLETSHLESIRGSFDRGSSREEPLKQSSPTGDQKGQATVNMVTWKEHGDIHQQKVWWNKNGLQRAQLCSEWESHKKASQSRFTAKQIYDVKSQGCNFD